MKTLTKITGDIQETDWREPHCHHHHIGQTHKTPNPQGKPVDYSRAMRVGPAGIIFSNGKVEFVIPIEELWKAAEKYEPGLAVPILSGPSLSALVKSPMAEIENQKPAE